MRFVEDDSLVPAGIEGAGEAIHIERFVTTESRAFENTRPVARHIGIADQMW